MYTILVDFGSDDTDIISSLPEEISSYIFIHLEGEDLLNCRVVCKTWKTICDLDGIKKKIQLHKEIIYQDYRYRKENLTPSSVTPIANGIQRLAFNEGVSKKLFNTSPVPCRLFISPSPIPISKKSDKSPSSRRQSPYLSPQHRNSPQIRGQFSSALGSISEGVPCDTTFQTLKESPLFSPKLSLYTDEYTRNSHKTESVLPAIRLFEPSPQDTLDLSDRVSMLCNTSQIPERSIRKQKARNKCGKKNLRRL